MRMFIRAALMLCAVVALVQSAALAASSYVVLPFKVNGPSGFGYLEKAIPSMLSSRLYVQDTVVPAAENVLPSPPASVDAVKKARDGAKADVAIWGEVNVIGDDATVDMRALLKDGKEWRKSFKSKTAGLVSALQNAATVVSTDVFGRAAPKGQQRVAAVPQLNSELVHNEITPQQTYLNPQFRYQGADGNRLRSQALQFASQGMAIADVTGDGKNNVVLLAEHAVRVYSFTDQLRLVAEYDLPRNVTALMVRAIDLDRDRAAEVVVCTYDPDYTEPFSYVLSFKGGKVREVAVRQRMYMNVVKLPPDFMPILVGQRGDPQRIFDRSGVHELMRQGNEFVFSRKLDLPSGVNVFNFAWLPAGGNNAEDLIVSLTGDDKLQVFNGKGTSLYRSDEMYSGSAVGIAEQTNMPGLGKGGDVIPRTYWIPLRMLATDLDQNRQWELLVNKPISVSAQIFDRYRSFPEGEISAMFWDGVGMNLLWKTRRIKGTVVDFDLGDVNNDGIPDLVVNVNTHPGSLGLQNRRTMIVAYPLDLNSADPNTPPVSEVR